MVPERLLLQGPSAGDDAKKSKTNCGELRQRITAHTDFTYGVAAESFQSVSAPPVPTQALVSTDEVVPSGALVLHQPVDDAARQVSIRASSLKADS